MGNAADKVPMLDPVKVPQLTKFIKEKTAENKIRIYTGDSIGYFDENEEFIRGNCTWQGCQAGLTVVGIDSIGNVKGCESLQSDEFIEGNLRNESLRNIWFKPGNFAYNRDFTVDMLTGTCKDCDKGEICRGGCRGSCFFNTKSKFENAYCSYNKVVKLTDNQDERIEELKREIDRQKKENEIAGLEAELEALKNEGQKTRKIPQPSRIPTPEPVIPVGVVRVTAYAVSHDKGNDWCKTTTNTTKKTKKSGIFPIKAAYAAPHDDETDRLEKVFEDLENNNSRRSRYSDEGRSDLSRTMSYCAPHDTSK
jgi:radical SAM protein with 4Fe4S-binding SPASM domain